MICDPCKRQKHQDCPTQAARDPKKPASGLKPEAEALQISGLCPCQHRGMSSPREKYLDSLAKEPRGFA